MAESESAQEQGGPQEASSKGSRKESTEIHYDTVEERTESHYDTVEEKLTESHYEPDEESWTENQSDPEGEIFKKLRTAGGFGS